MRLAAKLVLLYLGGLLLIVGLFSYLTIEQDRRLAIAEHERRAADIAASLQPSIERAIEENKTSDLPQLLSQSVQRISQLQVRWVEFGESRGSPRGPAVPKEMIVAESRVTTISTIDSTGKTILYTYVPVEVDANGQQSGGIEVVAPDSSADSRVRRSLVSSLVALFGVAALSGLVILIGGFSMVAKPLHQLIDKVHRVGRGDFTTPVQLKSRDELGKLGVAINEMCDQLSRQREELENESASRIAAVQQLRHAERLNTVGRLAAGIAHEIGTPLSVVSGRAELIAGGQLSEEDSQQSARAIQTEANRITRIVRQLLDFARQSTPVRSNQNMNELIARTVNLMQPLVAKQNAKIEVHLPDQPVLAKVDSGQIQQVLTNLILNAAQSADRDSEVTIRLTQQEQIRPGESSAQSISICMITIQDNGAGISEEDRQHIFEPFFTTKDVGEGTGLGLSISHGIVQEHGGWIDVESEPGTGSCFMVYLPVTDVADAAS